MAAYFIVICDKFTNKAEMEPYRQKAGPARTASMEFIAAGGPFEVIEGAPAEAVVMLRFPTMEEAKAWYNSPAYQAALPHRLASGEFRCLLVEGAN
jgi:uncharacterized protein (DUF1330 family)